MKRSYIQRSTRPMKKNGRRTNEWVRAWRWLKPRLEAANRTRCEFSFIPHECGGYLTPAHSKKRRMMQGPDGLGRKCPEHFEECRRIKYRRQTLNDSRSRTIFENADHAKRLFYVSMGDTLRDVCLRAVRERAYL